MALLRLLGQLGVGGEPGPRRLTGQLPVPLLVGLLAVQPAAGLWGMSVVQELGLQWGVAVEPPVGGEEPYGWEAVVLGGGWCRRVGLLQDGSVLHMG